MITGTIHHRNAVIELEIGGAASTTETHQAVIDTGFNGYLTLPQDHVTALRLAFAGHRRGALADGSVVLLSMYLATVVWHGRAKEVIISQTLSGTLVGMSLLNGSHVTMDVVEGGELTISELPQQT